MKKNPRIMIDEMLARLNGNFPHQIWIARDFNLLHLKQFLEEVKANLPEQEVKIA